MMIRGIVFALFFLSGALGLVYEITWMRQFRVILARSSPMPEAKCTRRRRC